MFSLKGLMKNKENHKHCFQNEREEKNKKREDQEEVKGGKKQPAN